MKKITQKVLKLKNGSTIKLTGSKKNKLVGSGTFQPIYAPDN